MKKKVLIIFPLLFQMPLVKGLSKSLTSNGLATDILYWKLTDMKFFSLSGLKKSFSYLFTSLLFHFFRKLPGAWRIGIAGYLKDRCYNNLIKNYDAIILAGVYDEDRLELAKKAKLLNKKIAVSLWGGDFYSINDYTGDWRNQLFKLSDLIFCGGLQIKNDFVNAFPYYSKKANSLSYGLSQFEMLKKIVDGNQTIDDSFLDERTKGKIVVTIGYSGRAWQQHFYALDAIEKLPKLTKDMLFLLLPMTYASEGYYKTYLQFRLDEIGIPYQILSNRLSLVQNLSMRMASDISIIIQKTDAMAASVQEFLMSGSVLIAGDWLPYGELTKYGVYFHKTSMEEIDETLLRVITNIKVEKNKCINNTKIMYDLRSWQNVGPQYANYILNMFV